MTIDLFMTMGQSNMAGRGVASLAPIVPKGYAYEFRAISDPTKLYDIFEPFGVNENTPGGIHDGILKTGSLISAFSIAYYNKTSVPAVYVSASKGGTSILEWQPGVYLLNDAIERLIKATTWLKSNGYIIRHTYILWSQGETDGDHAMSKQDYSMYLERLLEEMCVNQGIETCFLIRTGNHRDNPSLYSNIKEAQTEYCKTHSHAVLVSVKFEEFAEKGLMKDVFHYTQKGYNMVGEEAGINTANFVTTGTLPVYE